MFSRTEHRGPTPAGQRRQGQAHGPIAGCRTLAGLAVALFAATGCGPTDDRIATITRDSGVPEVAKCSPVPFTATDMGLDLYFVIDHSTLLEAREWALLWLGLTQFFAMGTSTSDLEPAEFAGIGVGFALYPAMPEPASCVATCGSPLDCDCLEDVCKCVNARPDFMGICSCREWPASCLTEDYAPTFEIATLREGQHAQAIIRIPAEPNGAPALRPALLGSLRAREEWEDAHPRRRVTQVLISATPSADWACNSRISEIERVLSGQDKPKTYIVAVNDSEQDPDRDYERLALAGRTEFVTRIRLNADTNRPVTPAAQLVDLVRYIREAEGRCEYLVPGGASDYTKLNLTALSGGARFPNVPDSAACERNPQGWYYDPPLPATPTRMIACEGACKTLHGPTGKEKATASIEMGCPTVLDAGP